MSTKNKQQQWIQSFTTPEGSSDPSLSIYVGCCDCCTTGAHVLQSLSLNDCDKFYSYCYEIEAEPGTPVLEVVQYVDSDGESHCISNRWIVPGLTEYDLLSVTAYMFSKPVCDLTCSKWWSGLATHTLGALVSLFTKSRTWWRDGSTIITDLEECGSDQCNPVTAFQLRHDMPQEFEKCR